ncbi:hypothetical protein K439DRAFT_1405640 [Ramaria rubella]|nr:hypothetical protein K439DRAFT_1405640 [Ramaria rubella]
MGPTRSQSSGTKNEKMKTKYNSTAKVIPSAPSLPGVQKIKSSLRQTRRMLAKDSLAADLRIETERRLKSLESDLAKAERTRKERNFAVKYHKVKFFERQKVWRKIKQAKKELEDPETPPENLTSLREILLSHRVDLNYILHYPKSKKYISLFPPKPDNDAHGNVDTDHQREELRSRIKAAMETGEMDAEPEVTMDKRRLQSNAMDWEDEPESHPHSEKTGKQFRQKGVPGDTFFEDDSDDQHQSDGG